MAKVDMIGELISSHNDAEIIEHMYKMLQAVHKNYLTALDKGTPELLYANIGDLALVTETLKRLKQRNDNIVASTQSS